MKKLLFVLIIILFGIGVVGCSNIETSPYDIRINNLRKIENDEERLRKIIILKRDIESLSTEDISKINKMKAFDDIVMQTLEALKDTFEWSDFFNKEVTPYELEQLILFEKIETLMLIRSFYSVCWPIENKTKIKKFLDFISISYFDTAETNQDIMTLYDIFCEHSADFFVFTIETHDGESISIKVLSLGFISIYVKGETISKEYYSLTKIDFQSLCDLCKDLV